MTLEKVRIKPNELVVSVEKVEPGLIKIVKKDYDDPVVVQNMGKVEKMSFESGEFAVGSTVVFPAYAGRELSLGGLDYLIMGRENIIAVAE